MNPLYEWLYDHYAEPQLDEAMLPTAYQEQKRAWLTAAEALSPGDRLLCADLMESLKCHWGTQAFVCGLRAGFMLKDLGLQEHTGCNALRTG